MIDFMVLGSERSGTTWAANWLTTDTSLCLHDPLLSHGRFELDSLQRPFKTLGLSCTALPLWPNFVNSHPARKVILHREPAAIAASWERLEVNAHQSPKVDLDAIESGYHLYWGMLFERKHAMRIWQFLLDRPWTDADDCRHYELAQMNIQPNFATVNVSKTGISELTKRIGDLLES